MPTLQNWEDYLEMEEEFDIQDTREKVLHKKNKSNKPNKPINHHLYSPTFNKIIVTIAAPQNGECKI